MPADNQSTSLQRTKLQTAEVTTKCTRLSSQIKVAGLKFYLIPSFIISQTEMTGYVMKIFHMGLYDCQILGKDT